MARRKRFASYPKMAHASGQARIKINGKAYYLGKFGSEKSWAEYNRLMNEWRADILAVTAPEKTVNRKVRTVGELIAHWWLYAKERYQNPDGTPKGELEGFRYSLAPLLRLFADLPVNDFGTKALMALQRVLASGSWMNDAERAKAEKVGRPIGWSRKLVNRSIVRVRTMFRWAEREELVAMGTAHHLGTVPGLQLGQGGVRETADVAPVPEENLAKTLPQLRRIPRSLVELLLLTGARPGELFKLRPCDLDRSGMVEVAKDYRVELGQNVWAYQPEKHKTAYKGHRRVILFGPRAQAVLNPFLDRPADRHLFRPCEARGNSGDRYQRQSLNRAIHRACKRAGVPGWNTYRLRHNAATRIAEEFDLEIARVILGHRNTKTTQIYAVDSLKKAAAAVNHAG